LPADEGPTSLKPKWRLFPQQSAASPLAPINGAAAPRNIPQEDEGRSATLASAHALASLPLLWRRQKQKCLHFIHKMIFL
jgi:hypothetical protein